MKKISLITLTGVFLLSCLMGSTFANEVPTPQGENPAIPAFNETPPLKEKNNDSELVELLNKVAKAHDNKNFREAETLLREGIEKAKPSSHFLYLFYGNLGQVLFAQQKFAESEEYLLLGLKWQQQARATDPDTSLSHLIPLAKIALSKNEPELAKQYIQQAWTLTKSPNSLSPDRLAYEINELKKVQLELESTDYSENYLKLLDRQISRWHNKTNTLVIYITQAKQYKSWTPAHIDLVKTAFQQWNQVLDNRFNLIFSEEKRPYDVKITWTNQSIRGSHDSAGGINRRIYDGTNHYTNQDIEISLEDGRSNVYPSSHIFRTLLHEIGHSFGISGHSNNLADIMHSSAIVGKISSRDANTLKEIYNRKAKITNDPGMTVSEYAKRENNVQWKDQGGVMPDIEIIGPMRF